MAAKLLQSKQRQHAAPIVVDGTPETNKAQHSRASNVIEGNARLRIQVQDILNLYLTKSFHLFSYFFLGVRCFLEFLK